MTFGTDLKDQVPSILSYVSDGIQSLTQFRNFIKDRSAIEREYGQKLDHLARKYKSNSASKHKLNINESAQDEWDWKDNSSTSSAAWYSLLNQTSLVAKGRIKLADDINTFVVDNLRGLSMRKDDARKKHSAFYQKLKSDRDKTYAEKDKAKQLYDEVCADIENLKVKLGKTSGDHDKIQRQLDAAHFDCENKKNVYLLAIGAANAERSKYFEEDIPRLADYLEELDAERITALKSILRIYVDLEARTLKSIEKCNDDSLHSVENIDAAVDASVFIRNCTSGPEASERAANVEFTFLPWNGGANAAETIIDRDDNLVSSDSAIIYLNNRLIKDRKQLDSIGDELEKKSVEMNRLASLVDSIENKTSVDYDKAKDRLMEIVRDISIVSTQKVKIKSEVDLIIQNIGDDGLKAQNHDFKSSSFAIPTTCDYCNNSIWGLSNKGLTCRACGFNCHARCEMKVAPTCSMIKGQINPQPPLSPSINTENKRARTISATGSILSTPLTATSASTSPPPSFSHSSLPSQTAHSAFVRAVYTYTAQNSDELNFTEGDTLGIVEADDGSGWIKAQLGDEIGLVPANYIEYIDSNGDTNDTEIQHLSPYENYQEHESLASPMSTTTTHSEDQNIPDFTQPQQQQQQESIHPPTTTTTTTTITTTTTEPEIVVALYDFEAVNAEELNIKQGDTIIVTKKDDSGWWEGTLNGHTGIFPANYVES